MNTLAKVLRSGSPAQAAAVMPFTPDELGTGASPKTNSQVYQFPVLDLSALHAPLHTGAIVINPGNAIYGTHSHIFPALDELPVETVVRENEDSALERAMREKSLQEIRASVEAELSGEIGGLREELAETIARVSGLVDNITAKLETEAVALALEIAKKVVAREVGADQEVVLSVTKNALSKLHSRSLASVHLHPDEFAFVQENRSKLNFHGSLELIEDASVTPGGCLIHTDTGDIDARLETQFDEITNGLLRSDTH